jgi:hypothetical protein
MFREPLLWLLLLWNIFTGLALLANSAALWDALHGLVRTGESYIWLCVALVGYNSAVFVIGVAVAVAVVWKR